MDYHWHTEGRGHVSNPHRHLGPAGQVRHRPLANAHLPTGDVALQDVLRLAIEEFEAQPLKPDWAEILRRTRRAFEK